MKLARDIKGAIYVEFLVVFFPFFLTCMAIIQLALLSAARLTVQHAAIRGVRAAMVVLDDKPENYDNIARGCLTGGDSGNVQGFIDKLATSAIDAIPQNVQKETGINKGLLDRVSSRYDNAGPRLQAIRNASYVPLLSLAPDPHFLWEKESMRLAVGFFPESRLLSGIVYNKGAAAVTIHNTEQSTQPAYQVGKRDNVTVRVTYMYHCAVPLVSHLMCSGIDRILHLDEVAKNIRDTYKKIKNYEFDPQAFANYKPPSSQSAQPNQTEKAKRDYTIANELAHAETPALQLLFGANAQRFIVLRAQATLPNQGAGYSYLGEKDNPPEECEAPRESTP